DGGETGVEERARRARRLSGLARAHDPDDALAHDPVDGLGGGHRVTSSAPASSRSRVAGSGSPGTSPRVATTHAATAAASRSRRSGSAPRNHALIQPAANASPAPTGSTTTGTGSAGCCQVRVAPSAAVLSVAPRAPSLTTTV